MSWRRLMLKAAKWGGVGFCAASIVLWVVSIFSLIIYQGNYHGYFFSIGVQRGSLTILQLRADRTPLGFHADWFPLGRRLGTYGLGPPFWSSVPNRGFWALGIPFWIQLIVIGAPTALLWRRDRRRILPGNCACGYDLRGNVSGRCSECGTVLRPGA